MKWIAILAVCASAAMAEPQLVGVTPWPGPVGGLSAIEVADDGQNFTVVSDRGALQQGYLLRVGERPEGAIDAVALAPPARLLNSKGQPFEKLSQGDAEGVALGRDGEIYISFEGRTRVMRYNPDGTIAAGVPRPELFRRMRGNQTLESLAIGPGGHLLTIREGHAAEGAPAHVWQLKGKDWNVLFSFPRQGKFVPVGADMGPDGRLYVLERRFAAIAFASRVRRMALDGSGLETVLETQLGQFGNLEGISVWRDALGLRLTMISDDNLSDVQRSHIVEYRLPD